MSISLPKNILDTIGNTPCVPMTKLLPPELDSITLYAKIEAMNPGGSIKDRIALWMVEDCEKKGLLMPGGTIVESTSGNTGFGLALVAAVKKYQAIFTLPDKMSQEKIQNLKAFGAKVVVTPTQVEPEDPRSYYSVAKKLAQQTDGAIYMDQYNNPSNPDCHFHTTGPEILNQIPDLDYFFAGIGTGGTLCGIAKYLKSKNPNIQVIGIDPVGSIVAHYFHTGKKTEPKPYLLEGIGEDMITKNYDFSVVDEIVSVTDQEAFLMSRALLQKEGLFVGGSSGAALVGAIQYLKKQGIAIKGKKALAIFPDSGDRYLSKIFNDTWMKEQSFL